jgi:importin-5
VLSQPDKVFVFIAQALEAETLQGQIASRVVAAAKLLLGMTGRDPTQLMLQLNPETQQTVRTFFS